MYLNTLTISAEKGWLDQRERFSANIAGKEQSNYTLLSYGELSYNHGNSKLAKYGVVFALKNYTEALVPRVYHSFKLTPNHCSIFIEYLFASKKTDKELSKLVSSSARMDGLLNITYNAFMNIKIQLPNLAEQSAIGNFFQQLDDTINLNQRKLEKLKELKKGFLQQVFSKRLRFKGFEDEWKQRRLKDISYKVLEKNKENIYKETFTNSAEYGIVSQQDFFDKSISNEKNIANYYVVKNNDFVYNPRISNSAPVGPIKRNSLGRTGIMSPLYYVFRTHTINNTYLEYYFETTKWHRFMKESGDSGVRSDRLSIKDSVLVEMPVSIPHIEEQTVIGDFFQEFDQIITLQEKRLESIKKLKQSLLSNMLI